MDLKRYEAESLKWYDEVHLEPLRAAMALCESPIETAVFWALLRSHFTVEAWHGSTHGVPGCANDTPVVMVDFGANTGRMYPQLTVTSSTGRLYRIDLACHYYDLVDGGIHAEAWIAVECDGHEFHERTKEQAERDKERDRDLQELGWNVARFTGSEIARSPEVVASKIDRLAFAITEREWKRRAADEARAAALARITEA